LFSQRLVTNWEDHLTMAMMSIEGVKRAEVLIEERGRIVAANWYHVTAKGPCRDQAPADEELQRASEEYRKRKLDAIDAQLRELGVNATEQDSDTRAGRSGDAG
jgi:hypothetical protein